MRGQPNYNYGANSFKNVGAVLFQILELLKSKIDKKKNGNIKVPLVYKKKCQRVKTYQLHKVKNVV